MQATIRQDAAFLGVGLHTGAPARLVIRPATAGHGIIFRRTDLRGRPRIPALWHQVSPSRLSTLLEGEGGVTVSTIEHVMAALAGTGIVNALIDLHGPEVPILDGSAAPFVDGILAAGIVPQNAPARAIRVRERVEVREGLAWAALAPGDHLEIEFEIDFPDAAIGRQRKRLDITQASFVRELADSRTFCRLEDVAAMQAAGLARGGSYLNAVVIDGTEVLTPGGLRHPDEAVRHKMLDALGDLALAGAPLLARFSTSRGGHALTNRLLRALFADETAWELVEGTGDLDARLPGQGLALPPAARQPAAGPAATLRSAAG
ncbi:UDP-3-O-acyl-N-acetylglucosamine deacetylase [Paracoccus sp. S-4012]|uniref:UDP-3-O-acyl-N-acetylglucosamine deacetylase n=1 Tax=Paracoccus sp. S-4012 TaxID=2665648 RepID=UPI0012B1290E|nr:UDP-3-O-acyl-N-acetylglucosamine deacetylase [Paracoccus sp. S-4012]MRX49054.1 UDP-3-O-acyl-N-acetylglucosamine deacetylase [Paracoccus sp. S-4012]